LHRTFAEYLLARHLAALPDGDWLAATAEHQWFDPDWEHVTPMLAEQLSPAAARTLVAFLLDSNPAPFLHSLFTALRAGGARPDADTLLPPGEAAGLSAVIRAALRNRYGRDLLSRQLADMTYLPNAVRDGLVTGLGDGDPQVRWAAVRALADREGQ